MGYDDERAKLFLPFAAVGGMEELLALQEESDAQKKADDAAQDASRGQSGRQGIT